MTGFLMTGVSALAKPPELPINPTTDGKVPTPMEQEHFQPAKGGEPSLTSSSRFNSPPGKYEPPIATRSNNAFVSLAMMATEAARYHFKLDRTFTSACLSYEDFGTLAWDRRYRSIAGVSPKNETPDRLESRIKNTTIIRVANFQTAEPPFASKEPTTKEATPEISAIQLKVLWEAARQYRQAVEAGDKKLIEETSRTLDNVLRQTKTAK